jgi:predicted ATP-grasp superfamily ATP-dependent carboligase
MNPEIRTILVAGFSTRHVVSSAVRAGYRVCAADHFCDSDLRAGTIACARFDELAELPGIIARICGDYPVDAIITTSGAEELEDLPVPLLGTSPRIAARFLDKMQTQEFFEEGGWPVPRLSGPGRFPAILKPCRGAGGWRNTRVMNRDDIRRWEEEFPGIPYLLQDIAPGIPVSVCCATDGRRARALAVNLQILRGSGEARYGFSGSQTPYHHPLSRKMRRMAEEIAAATGCRGIIGIDFLITEERIFPIEVNPRFVATLDTIERSTGLNLVRIHIDACQGILPGEIPEPDRVAVRKILFAPRDTRIADDLTPLIPDVADIPVPPAEFLAGEAVISVYGEGHDEQSAYAALDKTIMAVSQYMR